MFIHILQKREQDHCVEKVQEISSSLTLKNTSGTLQIHPLKIRLACKFINKSLEKLFNWVLDIKYPKRWFEGTKMPIPKVKA